MSRFPRRLIGAMAPVAVVAAVSAATVPSAPGAPLLGPTTTEISCIMSFAQSHYHYDKTPSQHVTTFTWGSNGFLPMDCRGRVDGQDIDATRTSRFNEAGEETATCTQGAGWAATTLIVPTVGGGTKTKRMIARNTFTATGTALTFNISSIDNDMNLAVVGSWALPTSSAPCPLTSPGPIPDIQVAHTFHFYSTN